MADHGQTGKYHFSILGLFVKQKVRCVKIARINCVSEKPKTRAKLRKINRMYKYYVRACARIIRCDNKFQRNDTFFWRGPNSPLRGYPLLGRFSVCIL